MATKYKMLTHSGPYRTDEIVTDEQIKGLGVEVEDWKKRGIIGDAGDEPATAPVISDAALKANIERRVREDTAKLRRPLTPEEHNTILGEEQKKQADALEEREKNTNLPQPPPAKAANPAPRTHNPAHAPK